MVILMCNGSCLDVVPGCACSCNPATPPQLQSRIIHIYTRRRDRPSQCRAKLFCHAKRVKLLVRLLLPPFLLCRFLCAAALRGPTFAKQTPERCQSCIYKVSTAQVA